MDGEDIERFRTRARLAIMEALLIDLHALIRAMCGVSSIPESIQESIDQLETIGRQIEQSLLANHQPPEEAAVYADELRAIVEKMKTRIRSIPDRIG